MDSLITSMLIFGGLQDVHHFQEQGIFYPYLMIILEIYRYSSRRLRMKLLEISKVGRKVKRLMTDNGLEFFNETFDNYYVASSIARYKTTASTPQQNGLA